MNIRIITYKAMQALPYRLHLWFYHRSKQVWLVKSSPAGELFLFKLK